MIWLAFGVGAVIVYCAGYVVTVGIVTRRCYWRSVGHMKSVSYSERRCNHLTDTGWPFFWPLVLPLAVVAAVPVGVFLLTRRFARNSERRAMRA